MSTYEEKLVADLRRDERKIGVWSEVREDMINAVTAAPTVDAEPMVHCGECEYLMFSDMYGECSKGYMGIVSPNDYCSRGKRKDGDG